MTFTATSNKTTDVLTLDSGTTTSLVISNGTAVTCTATTGAGPIGGTVYFAGTVTATTFQLFTDPGLTSLLDLVSDTSGIPFVVHGLSGMVMM